VVEPSWRRAAPRRASPGTGAVHRLTEALAPAADELRRPLSPIVTVANLLAAAPPGLTSRVTIPPPP
jgi:hypothetical protein